MQQNTKKAISEETALDEVKEKQHAVTHVFSMTGTARRASAKVVPETSNEQSSARRRKSVLESQAKRDEHAKMTKVGADKTYSPSIEKAIQSDAHVKAPKIATASRGLRRGIVGQFLPKISFELVVISGIPMMLGAALPQGTGLRPKSQRLQALPSLQALALEVPKRSTIGDSCRAGGSSPCGCAFLHMSLAYCGTWRLLRRMTPRMPRVSGICHGHRWRSLLAASPRGRTLVCSVAHGTSGK
jgi:hypothetical protein